jgi:hypothetical protein
MVKKLEGYSAWEKGGVHEHASAERNCERHWFRLGQCQECIRLTGIHYLVDKHDLDVCDRQFGLIDN